MPEGQVGDVMATGVITAPDYASFAEVAALLADHRIRAVPMSRSAVAGVVSWPGGNVDGGEAGDNHWGGWRRRWAPALRWPGGTAGQVTSAGPLTIGPEREASRDQQTTRPVVLR